MPFGLASDFLMLVVKFRSFSALIIIVANKQRSNSNLMKIAREEQQEWFYYTA